MTLLASPAQFMLARSLMCRGCKMLIASSATSTFGNNHALIRLLKIVHNLARLCVEQCRADRYLQRDGPPILTRAIRAHAVLASLGLVFRVVAEVNQSV